MGVFVSYLSNLSAILIDTWHPCARFCRSRLGSDARSVCHRNPGTWRHYPVDFSVRMLWSCSRIAAHAVDGTCLNDAIRWIVPWVTHFNCLQYVSLLLVLLVLTVAFMFLSPKDVFKKYALQTVETHWEKEQNEPGSMDYIQRMVRVYDVCI